LNHHKWADAAEAHRALRPLIDPRLCHRSMWWLFFQQYALAPFVPRFGTVQVGWAPFDDGHEQEAAAAVAA